MDDEKNNIFEPLEEVEPKVEEAPEETGEENNIEQPSVEEEISK